MAYFPIRFPDPKEGTFLHLVHTLSVTLAIVVLLDLAAQHAVPWQGPQDPRLKLLWFDSAEVNCKAVLLGDSIFGSYYVDSPEETLWSRMEAMSGARVFPGALTGSTALDIRRAATLVARTFPRGTVAFIDIHPERFIPNRLPEPPSGNYAERLDRMIAKESPLASLDDLVSFDPASRISANFFLYVHRDEFKKYLKSLFAKPVYFRKDVHRNRVWHRDGTLARNRHDTFMKHIRWEEGLKPFSWMSDAADTLKRAGMRPVFVLSPLNVRLIEEYTSPGISGRTLEKLREARYGTATFLRENGIDFIDLSDDVPSDGFADTVHTNSHGNTIVAEKLASWLRARGYGGITRSGSGEFRL